MTLGPAGEESEGSDRHPRRKHPRVRRLTFIQWRWCVSEDFNFRVRS